jgi:hypothetical protein
MYQVESVFVVPGAGRLVPLPLPGGGSVPAEGKSVQRTMAVERLITTGDLVIPPAPESEADRLTAEAAQLTQEAATLKVEAAAAAKKGS